MIFNLNLSQEYKTNNCRLEYLSHESYSFYENLRISLKFMQKIGIPTIGNPVLKLENKVLTLVYSVMQHQINCDLYDGLVIEDVGDKGLQAQLIGLYEMTNILSLKYHEYLEEWANLKSETGKQLLKFDKLSIPA